MRKFIIVGAAALTFGATAFVGVAGAQDLPPTSLNVIGNLVVTTQFKKVEQPFWTKTIPERSGGKLQVTFKGWEEMGLKGDEVHRLMQQGVAHIGHISLGRMSGDFPITEATDLAGLSPSLADLRKVVDAFRPVMSKMFEERLGLIPLTFQSFQAQILYCRDPVRSLNDLKGKKVRAHGATQGDFLEAFGASSIPLAFGEVQQALATGVVDCALTGTLGGYSARWYESAKHLYTLPINYAAGVTVANSRQWARLPESVRQFLTTNVKELEKAMWDLNQEEGELGILCNTTGPCSLGKPGGMTRHDPSAEDLKRLRDALTATVIPRWAKRCGAACVAEFNRTIGAVTGLQAKIN